MAPVVVVLRYACLLPRQWSLRLATFYLLDMMGSPPASKLCGFSHLWGICSGSML
jgi:hypothetical protein